MFKHTHKGCDETCPWHCSNLHSLESSSMNIAFEHSVSVGTGRHNYISPNYITISMNLHPKSSKIRSVIKRLCRQIYKWKIFISVWRFNVLVSLLCLSRTNPLSIEFHFSLSYDEQPTAKIETKTAAVEKKNHIKMYELSHVQKKFFPVLNPL